MRPYSYADASSASAFVGAHRLGAADPPEGAPPTLWRFRASTLPGRGGGLGETPTLLGGLPGQVSSAFGHRCAVQVSDSNFQSQTLSAIDGGPRALAATSSTSTLPSSRRLPLLPNASNSGLQYLSSMPAHGVHPQDREASAYAPPSRPASARLPPGYPTPWVYAGDVQDSATMRVVQQSPTAGRELPPVPRGSWLSSSLYDGDSAPPVEDDVSHQRHVDGGARHRAEHDWEYGGAYAR